MIGFEGVEVTRELLEDLHWRKLKSAVEANGGSYSNAKTGIAYLLELVESEKAIREHKLDRRRPYGEIYGTVTNGARYVQDGREFTHDGKMIEPDG